MQITDANATLKRVFWNNIMNAVLIMLVAYNIRLQEVYHEQAVHGREQILAMERRNEQMIVTHMQRTVERWEKLQQHNPQLRIDQIPEPVPYDDQH